MPLPPEKTLDDVKIRIREAYTNPNVGNISQVVLKDGPRAFRIATLLEIVEPRTHTFHHYSLKIDHIDRRKNKGWFAKPDRSMRLEGGSPDEIERLYRFLHAAFGGDLKKGGELHVIRAADYERLEALLNAIPNLPSSDKIELIRTLLDHLGDAPQLPTQFVHAFERSAVDIVKQVADASRLVEYRDAYRRLQALVDDQTTTEQAFQEHLSNHPWMFGSEYSELIPRRSWTRDDKLDFMLRRTADAYIEIVEIKTAFRDPLFVHDRSRNSRHPSAKLAAVLGQVIRYVEEVERNRDSIRATDHEDPLKIRARVIAGRDGDTEDRAALRNLNGHLHGIEIITYDQLLRVAARVLTVFDARANRCRRRAGRHSVLIRGNLLSADHSDSRGPMGVGDEPLVGRGEGMGRCGSREG